MTGIPVLAATSIDPGCARIEITLPEGLTIEQIVRATLPGLTDANMDRCRVALVTPRGTAMILRADWHRVRPNPGVRVVIRLIPGEGGLKSILSIVVSIAAVALGTMFGAPFAAMLGITGANAAAIGGALISVGVNLLGNMLINALIPPVKEEKRPNYQISGWRNRMDPDGAVPVVLGELRYAPPFAARSWTEIIGDWQYVHAYFNFGEGQLELSEFRIGETAITEYDEVESEIRLGLTSDDPITQYLYQILEESIGVEVTRPLIRDDLGEPVDGDPTEEKPVVRTTGADASQASIILAWPAGLVKINDKGKRRTRSVSIRIRQRLVQDEDWLDVTTLTISAKKAEGFYRQHTWALPSRGRWQIELTMLTDETDSTSVQQRTVWAALQTIRPEKPINYPHPLALVALRVKATHQLNGALDNFSALVKRVCLDWDHVTSAWVMRATSNPASLLRFVLQCPANPKIPADAEIDLELLAEWHDFCRLRGLHYNRVLEQAGSTLRDILTEVAAAGRATPRHDGLRWGVVIDRPAELIVDHISPRNSWNFSCRRTYAEKPHAFVVKFADESNDFKEAQRIIRRPGYGGDITLLETLDLPGLTNAEIVYREALRRFFEAEYRPDVFEITQESAIRAATRGDTLAMSHDVLTSTQWAGRVRGVVGNLVELDETVTMVEGQTYGLRFRVGLTEEDTIGQSLVRTVATAAGETNTLMLTGTGAVPDFGDIVHFGPAASESAMVIVTGVETTQDQCSIIRAVAAAPEIDTLTAEAVVPEWSSRVGSDLDPSALAPATPSFASIVSGVDGTDDPDLIILRFAAGEGTISPASYQLDHRLSGAGSWTTVTISAAEGGAEIASYVHSDLVQFRLRAVSAAGVQSGNSTTVTITVGGSDLPLPGSLGTGITVETLLGGARLTVITPVDANLAQVQIYHSLSGTLNRATDAYGSAYAAEGARSYLLPVGDQTRVNKFANPAFSDASAWTIPTDVSIASGVATKVAGASNRHLTQAPALTAGDTLRVAFGLTAWTAGNVRMRCLGTTTADAIVSSVDGNYRGSLVVPSTPGAIGPLFNATSAGSIDNVIAYIATPACLPQGLQYLWLEPQNSDGAPGPVAGPFAITID